MNRSRVLAAAVLLLALASTRAAAQQPADGRWRPWLGCWSPAQPASPASPPVICVIPAAGVSAVEVLRVAEVSVTSRTRVAADGEPHAFDRDGCAGWDRAQWSADGLRLFVSAEHRCAASRLSSSGVMAMGAGGQWLEVQGVNADSGEMVGVQRFVPAAAEMPLPEEIVTALAAVPDGGARGVPPALSPAEVIEAQGRVSPLVLDAFVAEAGKELHVNARDLVRLAAAGVPARTIDLMVALANPRAFAVAAAGDRAADAAVGVYGTTVSALPASHGGDDFTGSCVRFSPGWYRGELDYGYRYTPCGRYSDLYYQIYYREVPRVQAVAGTGAVAATKGRVVNGQGYSSGRPRGTEAGVAATRPRSSGALEGGTDGRGSAPSSATSGGYGSGSTSTSTGRTAHPRP